MFYTDDPIRDFDRYDMALAQREARLPVCEKCKKPINDDTYFEIDEEILCEKCMHDRYARSTEDWLLDQ
jgi:formylmethanofuran dehydrogenase subunit E